MYLEQGDKAITQVGESVKVFAEGGEFSKLFAKENFAVNDFQGAVRVVVNPRFGGQNGFGGDSISDVPATPLLGSKVGGQVGKRPFLDLWHGREPHLFGQTEIFPHTTQSSGEANAKRVGLNADLRADLVPRFAQSPLIGDLPLFRRQVVANGLQQIEAVDPSRRVGLGVNRILGLGRAVSALIAAGSLLVLGVVDHPISGHRSQERDQLIGSFQLELASCGASEEIAEDRLANVHRVENSAQLGVRKPGANRDADGRFVSTNKFGTCRLVARSNPANQLHEFILRHALARSM